MLGNGLIAWVPLELRAIALVALVLALILANPDQIPQLKRQIPSTRLMSGPSGFFAFGLEYGTGLRTYLPSRLPHIVVLIGILAGTRYPLDAILLGLGFGASRALPAFGVTLSNKRWMTRPLIAALLFGMAIAGSAVSAFM